MTWTPLLATALAAPVTITFTDQDCDAGSTRWVSTDQARLRASPSVHAPVLAALPVGATLQVQHPSRPFTLGEREGVWCAVTLADGTAGYLFSGLLTRRRLQADFDEDGVVETAYLGWAGDRSATLWITDPDSPSGAYPLPGVSFSGIIELSVVTGAGFPLLALKEVGAESCESVTAVDYLTWRPRSGRPSAVYRVAQGSHQAVVSDALRWIDESVTFQAEPGRAIVTRVVGVDRGGEVSTVTDTITRRWNGDDFVEVSRETVTAGPRPPRPGAD